MWTRQRRRRLRWCARYRCGMTIAVLAWLSFAGWILYAAIAGESIELPALFAIYLLLTVVCSAAAFVLVVLDARRAQRDRPRIPERTLHLLSAAGGWPGAYLAGRLVPRQSLRFRFRAVAWGIIGVHAAVILYGLWSGWFWRGAKLLLGWS